MAEQVMGMCHVMKPFWRFEYWYDRTTAPALSGAVPIALFPTGSNIPANGNPPAVDQRAYDVAAINAVEGYATNLSAMLPMPAIGSEVLIWLPQITWNGVADELDHSNCYIYVPVWRMRTVADTLRWNIQGNVVKESFGTPDTSGGPLNTQPRYILPGSMSHELISKQEFDTSGAVRYDPTFLQPTSSIREGIAMPTAESVAIANLPVSPTGGVLAYEQGIMDPAAGLGDRPSFKPYWLKVMGNELGFWVYKARYPAPSDTEITFVDWHFDYNPATGYCAATAEDFEFSHFFGMGALGDNVGLIGRHPETGVYVMTGIAS